MNRAPIDPGRSEFAFEAKVQCDPPRVIGPSKHGQHQLIPIVGGSFEGPRLRGDVLPGGADWQLIRPDGVVEIEAKYTIRVDDGALIAVRNRGIFVFNQTPLAANDTPGPYSRTTPEFEAPAGPHDWLNKWLFVGTLDIVSMSPLVVRIGVHRLF